MPKKNREFVLFTENAALMIEAALSVKVIMDVYFMSRLCLFQQPQAI